MIASLLTVAGSVGMAVLLGEMAVIITSSNRREALYQEIIDDAMLNLNNIGISKDLTIRVLKRITQAQNSLRSHEEYEIFQKFVSPSIQNQIAQALYDPVLSINPVFNSERNLLKFLLKKMKIQFTKDEEEIISEGQEPNAIYFIVAGEMKVMVYNNKTKKSEKVCFLKPGSHFGEIGLIYKTQRRATVVSEGYSTIAELLKKDFFSLTSTFRNIVPKMRDFTEVYNDSQKLFLVNSLLFQPYFKHLPEKLLNELPFMMKIIKVEKGSYLFKPGDFPSSIYILSEGKLELSVTINDKYIQHLKIEEGYADVNSLIKSSRRKQVSDYSNRHFDIFTVNGLKRKTCIFPYTNADGKLSSTKNEAGIPYNARKIGNYMQEIILADIRQGALINSEVC